jgi:DNA-binding IclR family transcriptional regulator
MRLAMAHERNNSTAEIVDKRVANPSGNGAGDLSESPIGTLERGLLLLELFDADNSEMSLGQLREKAGLPKATIQRLMKTLEARKWVAYESSSRKYHLGASVLRISYLAASHSELVRTTHPFLIKLAEETRETASLCVWTDLGPLLLDNVPTPRPFKPATNYGMILGLSTADSQVLIAFGPEEAWDRLLANPFEKRTELTITDPEELRERWRTVRQEGVAFDKGEWNIEIPAVAVPVFDRQGQLRGSLGIGPPVERAGHEAMLVYAKALKAAAAEIAKKLA